ncbi:hypothetical protein [Variovorax sp.]|uniref:hypothetical protein n=1 Tax=Variovorax sp. TaxID=1871043 RepID=UPI0025CCFA2D|nr:hypothetical protein [Variovorax sp.]
MAERAIFALERASAMGAALGAGAIGVAIDASGGVGMAGGAMPGATGAGIAWGAPTAARADRCRALPPLPGVSLVRIGRAQCLADGASKFDIAGSILRVGVTASVACTAGAGQRVAGAATAASVRPAACGSVAPQALRTREAHSSATRGRRARKAGDGIMERLREVNGAGCYGPPPSTGLSRCVFFSRRANPDRRRPAYQLR